MTAAPRHSLRDRHARHRHRHRWRLRRGAAATLVGVLAATSACSVGTAGTPVATYSTPSAGATSGGSVIPPMPPGPGGAGPTGSGAPGNPSGVPPSGISPTGGGTPGTGSGVEGGPPSWVVAGTRITFYVSSASVAASRFAWVEDPNGTWEDPTTGKKYRRTDESGENMGDGGGDGLSQFDVLAVDGDTVIVASSLLGIDRVASMYTAGPSAGGAVTGPVLDSVWVGPATLERASTQTLPGTIVMRGPYSLGGKTYQAIGFATTDPARYQSYIYDHDTGLMLSAITKMQGATSPLTPPDGPAPKANTQLGQWILAGVRQRQAPGLGGSTPGWAQSRSSLAYQGTYVIGNPMSPSTDPFTFPMTMDVTLRPLRGAWFSFQAVSTVQTQGMGPMTVSGVAGPTGPYWIDPAALTGLQAGQHIDSDPITREAVTVTAADQAVVTFTSEMPGLQTSATYSRGSGAMIGYRHVSSQAGVTITLQLISPP